MKRRTYHRQHWPDYCLRKQRVTVTLDKADFKALAARAGGRAPGQQLWLESLAYRQGRYLPPRSVEARLEGLQLAMARLHDALSTHQSPVLGKLPSYADAVAGLGALNRALDRFLLRPGRR